MRAFLFMKTVKIPLSERVLSTTEWSTYNHSIVDGQFPIIYQITDGSAVLFTNSNIKQWVDAASAATMFRSVTEDLAPKPEIVQEQNSISADTLLKAIALAQNPQLIKDIL